jgi:alpha-beta hydrolase superfamily lysophospholipase
MNAALILLPALIALGVPTPTAAVPAPAWSDYPVLQAIERSTVEHGGHRLDVLVRREGERQRSVLVLVPGSVCMPAFMVASADGKTELTTSAVLPKPATQSAMGVHVAILERRNIVSLQRYFAHEDLSPARQLEQHPCTGKYGGMTLEQRVEDTLAQLAYIRRQPWTGDILLAGMSEGADVAAAVAADPSSSVDALLLLSGAGMSQFFDFIHAGRNKGDRAGAAKAFADLDAFLRDAQPTRYLGYDSARWRSFAIDATPLDSLLGSRMPVFIVHGEQDTSVPIASIDAAVVELVRRQPWRAVHYWPIKGAEHDLRAGEKRPADTIYPVFVDWALDQPHGRTYRDN